MPSASLSPLACHPGFYYNQSILGNLFTAYVAAQATSVVGTSLVGLQLWNPPTSGRNLVLVDTAGMIIASSATTTSLAFAFGAQATAPTGQTPATTVTAGLLGIPVLSSGLKSQLQVQPIPAALALSAGTFAVTPAVFKNLLHNTAAISTTGEDTGWQIDLTGKWVIPPGNFVAIVAVGAAAAAGAMNADLSWIEAPV